MHPCSSSDWETARGQSWRSGKNFDAQPDPHLGLSSEYFFTIPTLYSDTFVAHLAIKVHNTSFESSEEGQIRFALKKSGKVYFYGILSPLHFNSTYLVRVPFVRG